MAFDWLFGKPFHSMASMPAMAPSEYDAIAFRGVVLDVDDIVDTKNLIVRRLKAIDGVTDIQPIFRVNREGDQREVDETSLVHLADVDRETLSLNVNFRTPTMTSNVNVNFARRQQPSANVGLTVDDPGKDALVKTRQAVVDRVLKSGPAIPQWARIAHWAIYIPWVALAAAMIWLQTTGPSAPLAIVGWIVTAAVLVGSVFLARLTRRRMADRHSGCRIIGQARATTRANRANTHRDVRVAFIAAPIGIFVGVVLALLGIRG